MKVGKVALIGVKRRGGEGEVEGVRVGVWWTKALAGFLGFLHPSPWPLKADVKKKKKK